MHWVCLCACVRACFLERPPQTNPEEWLSVGQSEQSGCLAGLSSTATTTSCLLTCLVLTHTSLSLATARLITDSLAASLRRGAWQGRGVRCEDRNGSAAVCLFYEGLLLLLLLLQTQLSLFPAARVGGLQVDQLVCIRAHTHTLPRPLPRVPCLWFSPLRHSSFIFTEGIEDKKYEGGEGKYVCVCVCMCIARAFIL